VEYKEWLHSYTDNIIRLCPDNISIKYNISSTTTDRISLTRSDSRTSRGAATLVISADSLKKFEEELLDLKDIN
jgi:hypothetical protein